MNPGDQHAILWERRQAELWDRIFQVTQDVVGLAETMEDTLGGTVLKQSLVKSAMSVGSELVRATASDNKNGFLHHLQESKMQAVEADYWLRLAYILQQQEDVQRDLSSIITQYAAIIDLLQKMIRHIRGEKEAAVRHNHMKGPKIS